MDTANSIVSGVFILVGLWLVLAFISDSWPFHRKD